MVIRYRPCGVCKELVDTWSGGCKHWNPKPNADVVLNNRRVYRRNYMREKRLAKQIVVNDFITEWKNNHDDSN